MKKTLSIITAFILLIMLMSACTKDEPAKQTSKPNIKNNLHNSNVQEKAAEVTQAPSSSTPEEERETKTDSMKDESVFGEQEAPGLSYSRVGEGNEEYGEFMESPFYSPKDEPLSTFSIDVDTASYANIRRMLNDGYLPQSDAVRVEECINYFDYDLAKPKGNAPFAINAEMARCPWEEENYLVMVNLNARDIESVEMVPSNLVFLIDVSGSMDSYDKIDLLKSGFKMLTERLTKGDIVSIVTYSGNVSVVLEAVSGDETGKINHAIDRLRAGGSTAGGSAMEMAYEIAQENFIDGGNNRIIMATDGDFNVGISSESELERFIERKRDDGVFLSILGFGTGNIKDNKMEILADKGNGNYSYIDSAQEANKVLVTEMSSTLYTLAKDVKIQVEFNPANVLAYRLIGYDNRLLAAEDFNDDTKDAGEMGMGHTVTAFYEIVPRGATPRIDPLRYSTAKNDEDVWSGELEFEWMYVKAKYKHPEDTYSQKNIELAVTEDHITNKPSDDFLFASAVAEFALVLKDSPYCYGSMENAISRAKQGRGYDEEGYKAEFVRLAKIAKSLMD
ncbi:MAG: VWA domain-containing protein [Clostridiales bacterium]|nr:VWA domain-containing protein [Clostridiales bacterium]